MDKIKKYYADYEIGEWKRLEKNRFHKLEYITTMRYLKKFLPKKGRILDAGGGPGRYTIALAEKRYKMTLLDYTPELLEIAIKKIRKSRHEKNVEAIIEGDIRDLSVFKNNSFDAVLCLGAPLSHVVSGKERLKSVREMKRVAKKGAPIFISVIGRLAVLQKSIWDFPEEIGTSYFKKYRDTGDYFGGHGFAPMHMFLASDLKKLIEKSGLECLTIVGLEGLASSNEPSFNKMCRNKKKWKPWLETHFKTCEMSSVADTSQHILIIARK